jgi:hypothetical protein
MGMPRLQDFQMSTLLSIAKALTLLIVLAILGGVAGYVLYDVFEYRLPSGEWQPVSLGQEKAVRILGLDSKSYSAVYIQTNQGNVYACRGIPGGGGGFGSFTFSCELAPAPQVSHARFNERLYTPPQPPGEVSESFVGPGPHEHFCAGQTNFVILNDGSVWAWYKIGCCEVGCLFTLAYPLCGLVLGLLVGIAILIVMRRRRRRRETNRADTGSSSTRVAIRPVQLLGWLCLSAGIILALVLIAFGTGVNYRIYVPLINAGLIVLGIILLLTDKRATRK